MERFTRQYQEKIGRLIEEVSIDFCSGCQTQQGNQEAHTCLTMTGDEKNEAYFDRAFCRQDQEELLNNLKAAMQEDMLTSLTNAEMARVLVRGEVDVGKEDENGVSTTTTTD